MKTQSLEHLFDDDARGYLASYERVTDTRSFLFSERKRVVFELLATSAGAVLDVGCGPAVYTDRLVRMGCDVQGVDLSERMVALARSRGFARATFQQGDVERLPFPEKTFDAVLCVGVLEYSDRLETAVKELARVTKPGGVVIVTFPNGDSWLNKLDRALRGALRFAHDRLKLPGLRRAMSWEYAPRYLSAQEIEGLLAANGLSIERRRFHIFRLTFLNAAFPRTSLWVMRRMNSVSSRLLGANAVLRARRS